MKYRNKPIVIEALQLEWGMRISEIQTFIESEKVYSIPNGVMIKTLKGDIRFNCGDYIVKGIDGDFYPCEEEEFKETYELIGNE